jgi:hypothetical protein
MRRDWLTHSQTDGCQYVFHPADPPKVEQGVFLAGLSLDWARPCWGRADNHHTAGLVRFEECNVWLGTPSSAATPIFCRPETACGPPSPVPPSKMACGPCTLRPSLRWLCPPAASPEAHRAGYVRADRKGSKPTKPLASTAFADNEQSGPTMETRMEPTDKITNTSRGNIDSCHASFRQRRGLAKPAGILRHAPCIQNCFARDVSSIFQDRLRLARGLRRNRVRCSHSFG